MPTRRVNTLAIVQSLSRHARTKGVCVYFLILQQCVVSTIRANRLWIILISLGLTAASSLLPALFLIKPYRWSASDVSIKEWPSHLVPLACSDAVIIYVATYSRFGFSQTDHSIERFDSDENLGDHCFLRLVRVGWPFKAFYGYDQYYKVEDVKGVADSFCLTGFWRNWEYRFIPLCPTIGVAYNAIFFVFSLSLIIIITTYCVMIYRHSHALCIHCSYPIGHTGICSECGQLIGGGLGARR